MQALRTPLIAFSRVNGSAAPLRELDEVAYLRFASVYRAFESADDFEAEIAMLRAERDAAQVEPQPTG